MIPSPGPQMSAGGMGRRRFLTNAALRGVGISIGLPMLESLWHERRSVAATICPAGPTRMAFVYVPNGVNLEHWRSEGDGRDYTLGRSLEPLTPFKSDFQIVSGLAHRNGFAGPDGAGDHARATATILTGMRPRKTSGADIRAGISVDQLAAVEVGQTTRFASLELSCDPLRKSGPCDSGYACAYSYNMSWRNEHQPATPETHPRLVFERLFGAGRGADRASNLAARAAHRRSILDFVRDEAGALRRQLNAHDQRKLEEYLSGIRDIERQLGRFDPSAADAVADHDLPAEPPPTVSERIRLMADMLVLAFQTDSTRIATLMLAHDGSGRSFPEIGVGDGHHSLSHHENKPDRLEKIAKIDRFYAEQFAYLLGRLRGVTWADGRTLLDDCMVVYASGLSDGNRHRHDDLPVILAGRAGGRLDAGRHLVLPGEQPMANLFVTMLGLMGVERDHFGDSTGPLDAVLA